MPLMIKIPVDKSEQDSIASVLCDIDAEISKIEMRLKKTLNLKKAIMQQLITGKTRLINLSENDN